MSIQYHSNLGYQPPVTPDIQAQRMREMSRLAPQEQGAADVFNSSLNLPAYQRAAEDANRNYRMQNQSVLFGLAGSGLGQMAGQQAQQQQLAGSLLGALLRSAT